MNDDDEVAQEHIDAAVAEEQGALHAHMQDAQAKYLLRRCISLNAAARHAAARKSDDQPEGGEDRATISPSDYPIPNEENSK